MTRVTPGRRVTPASGAGGAARYCTASGRRPAARRLWAGGGGGGGRCFAGGCGATAPAQLLCVRHGCTLRVPGALRSLMGLTRPQCIGKH